MKTIPPHHPPPSKWKWTEYFEALHEYLYPAKVIIFSLILVAVALTELIRAKFPEWQPPWQLLRWVVTCALLGVLFIPPLVTVIKRHKN